MKKTCLFVLAALTAGIGLTACGEIPAASSSTPSSVTPTPSSAAPSSSVTPEASSNEGGTSVHEHTYATTYSYDATYHWLEPTCGDTTEVKDKAEHTFADGICTVCGYVAEDLTTYRDVTITINAKGIDEYSGKHAAIWLNTSIGATAKEDGSGTEWQTVKMSQDETDANKWTYTFSHVETDLVYRYNAYFGSDEAPDWDNGKNTEKGKDEAFTIEVTDDSYEFAQDATFAVPTEKYSFTVKITPIVKTSADADPEPLHDSTKLYMWCSVSNAAELAKGEDGVWSYDVTDFEGTKFAATPCLGTTDIDWNYQHGAYESGTWVQWNSYTWDVNADTTVLELTAYFKAQPDEVSAEAKTLTFQKTVTNWDNAGSSMQLIWTTSGSFSWKGDGVEGIQWTELKWSGDLNGYESSIQVEEGKTVYFLFYTWKADGDERYIGADSDNNAFSYEVTSDATVSNSDEFGDSAYSVTAGTCVYTDEEEEEEATKKTLTFQKTVTNWDTKGNEIQLVWTTNGSFSWKGESVGVTWTKLEWNGDINGYQSSIEVEAGKTVYFLFYTWVGENDERYVASDSDNTAFSYEVTSDATVSNADNFSEGAYSVTTGTCVYAEAE